MNINFHYYAVKALARSAGFDEDQAQLVAEYSQFIDDYSSKDTIKADWAPDWAIASQLAQPDGRYFKVKLVTTGFVTMFDSMALIQVDLQNRMLIPFHFIIPDPMTQSNQDLPTKPAQVGGDQIVNALMNQALAEYKADPTEWLNLVPIGCVTHVFADTYAHQGFSGHRLKANDYVLQSYLHRLTPAGAPADWVDETAQNLNVSPLVPYSSLPSIGHSTVGHAPDDTYCKFCFQHRTNPELYPPLLRDNFVAFLETANQIYQYFCRITGSLYNFPLYKPMLEAGFLADNYDDAKMQTQWSTACAAYPELNGIQFHYDKKVVENRLSAPLAPNVPPAFERAPQSMPPDDAEGDAADAALAAKRVSPEFWKFTWFADTVRRTVAGGFYNP